MVVSSQIIGGPTMCPQDTDNAAAPDPAPADAEPGQARRDAAPASNTPPRGDRRGRSGRPNGRRADDEVSTERIAAQHPLMMLLVAMVTVALLLTSLLILTVLPLSCELSRVTSAFIIATAVAGVLVAFGGSIGLRGTVGGIPVRAAGGVAAFLLCIAIVLTGYRSACSTDQAAFVIRNFRHVSGWGTTQDHSPLLFARIPSQKNSKLIATDEWTSSETSKGNITIFLSKMEKFQSVIEFFSISEGMKIKALCELNIIYQDKPPRAGKDIYQVKTEDWNGNDPIFAFNFASEPAITAIRNSSTQLSADAQQEVRAGSCLVVSEAEPTAARHSVLTQSTIIDTASSTEAITVPVRVDKDIWVVPTGTLQQLRSMTDTWKPAQIAVYVRGSPTAVPDGGATPGESVSPSEKSMPVNRTEVVRSSLPLPPEPAPTTPSKAAIGDAAPPCDQTAANAAIDRIVEQLTIEKEQLKTVVDQWSCARNRIADRLADLAAEQDLSTEGADTQRQLLDLVRAATSEVNPCWAISTAKREQRAELCASPPWPATRGRMRDLSIALPWSDKLRDSVIASLSASDATVRTGAQLVVANYPARDIQRIIETKLRAKSTPADKVKTALLADAYARMLYNAIFEYFFADELTTADVADIKTQIQQISATRGALSTPEQTATEAYLHYIRAVVLQKWRQTRGDADKDLIAESYGKLLALTADSARFYRFPHHIAAALAFDNNALEKFSELAGAQFNALNGGSALTLASDGKLSLYPVPPRNPAEPKADTPPLGLPTRNDRSPTVAFMKYGDWSLVYRNDLWGWLNTPQTTASNR